MTQARCLGRVRTGRPAGQRGRLLAVLAAATLVIGYTGFLWAQNFGPVTDRHYIDNGTVDARQVELGRLLFFDPILSGNRNISCATCHHPALGTADGLSLSVGEGGAGLGSARTTGTGAATVDARVARNAPALFNLGARQTQALFHDGRVAVDAAQPSGFLSPAGDALPLGLANVVAAQAMFPVTSTLEMAGAADENAVGRVAAAGDLAGTRGVWNRLARRLQRFPEYVALFADAFDEIRVAEDIEFVHAANAIAAYEIATYRSDQSPFDAFLRGDTAALDDRQRRGMNLFYGRAGCARCHGGVFQSDQEYHGIAMPQLGPGVGNGFDGHEDFGRENVTGDLDDRYRFRTPSLRNVELTGPWGHAGAYATLESMVAHYRDPRRELRSYDRTQAVLPASADLAAVDFVVLDDPQRVAAIAGANEARPARLNPVEIADLVAFLGALTDPRMRDLRAEIPARVPSGLSVQ